MKDRDFIETFGHRLSALLVLASSLVGLVPLHFAASFSLRNPPHFAAHLSTLVLGFLAMYLSFQLLRRKRLAFWLAVVTLSVMLIIALWHGRYAPHIMLYMLTLGVLVLSSPVFRVKSNNLSLRRAVVSSLLMFGCAMVYATIGFYIINNRAFNGGFSLTEAAKYALLQIVQFDSSVVAPATRQGHLFLLSIDMMSLTLLLVVVLNLFRPVRFALFPAGQDREAAREIMTNDSASVEDFFKLWPEDKHYFFNRAQTAVLAYKVQSGIALVLDGPTGNKLAFTKLIKRFTSFAEENGWMPAIIHADANIEKMAGKLGLQSVFIGNEAVIDVRRFAAETTRDKHFRYIENKAEREGLQVEVWQPPLLPAQVARLRHVSNAWLSLPGRREYTYIMGYFDASYVGASEVAVLKHMDEVIAYVNLIPSYRPEERSIDHMRHTTAMPSIGMHYLLKCLLESLAEAGVRRFNLGLSPLSGIEERDDPSMTERLLAVIKTFGSRYYSFAGLEQFKSKFRPDWQPRYILYKGGPPGLLRVTNALGRAVSVPNERQTRAWIIMALSVLAGVTYLSFLLAYPLGLSVAGLVSDLGAKGAPYNWVFNGLDIISGGLVVYLAYAGLSMTRSRVARWQYGLFALSGLSTIMAALLPLHTTIGFDTFTADSLVLHALFTALSIIGLSGAALLRVRGLRTGRIIAVLTLVTLALVTAAWGLLINRPIGDAFQQVQVYLTAMFIVVIGYGAAHE